MTLLDDAETDLLGAYEIVGDGAASPESRRRAQALLSAGPVQRVLEQRATAGSLWARARAALPGPSNGVHIAAGAIVNVHVSPQRLMRGPWWLGLTCASSLIVRGVTFGNVFAFECHGEVPGAFFDAEHPERLIPMAGKAIAPGEVVRIELQNITCASVLTHFTLWGNDADSIAVPDRLLPGTLSREVEARRAVELPAAAAAELRVLRGLVDQLIESARGHDGAIERMDRAIAALREQAPKRPAEPSDRDRYEWRVAADRAMSQWAAAPFEPGDVWESPTDES